MVRRPGPRRRALSTSRSSPSAPTGTWRVRAFTRPEAARRSARRASWSRTTCPTASSSISRRRAGSCRQGEPAEITVDGRFLYGAPAAESRPRRRDDGQAGEGARRALPATSSALADDEDEIETDAAELEDLPRDRRQRQGASSPSRSTSCRSDHAPARGADHRAAGRGRRPRGRAQADAAGRRRPRPMIGVKPLFAGRSLGEGETASFDVIVVGAGRQAARAQRAALRAAQDRDAATSGTAATAAGTTSRSSRRARVADGTLDVAADKPARIVAAGAVGPLPARSRDRRSAAARRPRSTFDAGWYADASADTPDLLEIALDKTEYARGRHHEGRASRRAPPAR